MTSNSTYTIKSGEFEFPLDGPSALEITRIHFIEVSGHQGILMQRTFIKQSVQLLCIWMTAQRPRKQWRTRKDEKGPLVEGYLFLVSFHMQLNSKAAVCSRDQKNERVRIFQLCWQAVFLLKTTISWTVTGNGKRILPFPVKLVSVLNEPSATGKWPQQTKHTRRRWLPLMFTLLFCYLFRGKELSLRRRRKASLTSLELWKPQTLKAELPCHSSF